MIIETIELSVDWSFCELRYLNTVYVMAGIKQGDAFKEEIGIVKMKYCDGFVDPPTDPL